MTNEDKYAIEQYGSLERYEKIKHMRRIGSLGGKKGGRPFRDPMLASRAGKASSANLTKEQRQERSKKALEARWGKKIAKEIETV